MSTVDQLYLQAEEQFNKFFREDNEALQRRYLHTALSFMHQAIAISNPPVPFLHSKLAQVLFHLGEYTQSKEHSYRALQLDRYNFLAHYILFRMFIDEFEASGGFEAKAPTKVRWGWLALGAILSPEAAGDRIGKHLGNKLGKGLTSKEAEKHLYAAYSGMIQSFVFASSQPTFYPDVLENNADIILDEAEVMQAAGYQMKPVYQVIWECLSRLPNCGPNEKRIRELQAQAAGALTLFR